MTLRRLARDLRLASRDPVANPFAGLEAAQETARAPEYTPARRMFAELMGGPGRVSRDRTPDRASLHSLRVEGGRIDLSTADGDKVTVDQIYVPPAQRGQRAASDLLDAVIGAADRACVPLGLVPIAGGDCQMRDRDLEAWYARRGFSPDGPFGKPMTRPAGGPAPDPEAADDSAPRQAFAKLETRDGQSLRDHPDAFAYCSPRVGDALIDMSAEDDEICINEIWVAPPHRGEGVASEMLDAVISAADAAGARIGLRPDADPGGSMDNDALEAWYARRGFTRDMPSDYAMSREAAMPATAPDPD